MNKLRRQHSDYWISLIVFALIAFGLIMIYSVSKYYSLQITEGGTDKYYLKKQLVSLAIGIVILIVSQSIDYRFWQKHAPKMLLVTLFLLCLPLLLGGSAHRWVGVGMWQFQPSEIAKLTFLIYLCGWYASKKGDLKAIREMFWPFIVVMGAVAFLMLIQKDLGTLAIFVVIATSIFIAAGAPMPQLAAGGGMAAFLLWVAIKLEPYRLQRVLTFLNPEDNTLGAGYHIRNALIAIGSGGLFGLGFGQSRQKYLYLPEAHTDSIFAIISEELGFVRSVVIIILFAMLALRGYKVASKVSDPFARLLAVAITTWITIQAFINLAAMLSMVPLTGVPLPFISYGGSSLMLLLGAIGILINVSKFEDQRR